MTETNEMENTWFVKKASEKLDEALALIKESSGSHSERYMTLAVFKSTVEAAQFACLIELAKEKK